MADERQFCTFHLGDQYLGLDVLRVQEIIRYQEMTHVPLAHPVVRGLINLRGQIITARARPSAFRGSSVRFWLIMSWTASVARSTSVCSSLCACAGRGASQGRAARAVAARRIRIMLVSPNSGRRSARFADFILRSRGFGAGL